MEKNAEDHEFVKAPMCLSARLTIALEGMFGFAILYLTRINLSIAIVCMTSSSLSPKNSSIYENGNGSFQFSSQLTSTESTLYLEASTIADNNAECASNFDVNSLNTQGEFHWDKELRGLMLSSFFWGYIITQLPGGALANRFGGKHVLGTGMLLSTVANILIPPAARLHPYLVITLRFVMGLGHGVVFPSMHGLWGRWAPPLERSKLIASTYAGTMIGTVAAMVTSGYICGIDLNNGWPFVFYIHGFIGLIWWLLWLFLVYDTPSQHPRISSVEKQYIQSTIGPSAYIKKFAIPWKSIFMSRPMWAIIIAHSCNNWGSYTILTCIPTYMKEVLHFDIKSNGVLSAVPYISMYFAAIFAGQLADFLRSKNILSTTTVRKLFQTAAFLVPSAFITAVGFVKCENRYLGVVFLTICVTFTAFGRCAYSINHVDIAPRFSAILFAITNTSATIPGMISPYIASALTKNGTQEEWQRVFFICGAVYAFGWIAYTFMASGEEQSWAKVSTTDNTLITNVKKDLLQLKKLQD